MPTVCAWIVGVETYGGDGELDIPARIVDRALDVARALIHRDGTTRILANLSHDAAHYADSLALLGAHNAEVRSASLQDIRTSVDLLERSDVLVLYWIGHGVVREDKRQVLTADSKSPADYTVLDIGGLLRRLQSSTCAPLQVGFFDCCAQLTAAPTETSILNTQDLADCAQHFYFSSRYGQTVSTSTRDNRFAVAVKDAIEGTAWPLAAGSFTQSITTAFAARGVDEFHRTTGSGDVWERAVNERARHLEAQARRSKRPEAVLTHLAQGTSDLVIIEAMAEALRGKKMAAYVKKTAIDSPQGTWAHLLQDAWQRVRLSDKFLSLAEDLALPLSDWLELAQALPTSADRSPALESADLQALMLRVLDINDPERSRKVFAQLLHEAANRAAAKRSVAAAALQKAMKQNAELKGWMKQLEAADSGEAKTVFLQINLAYDEATGRPILVKAWHYANSCHVALELPEAGNSLAMQVRELLDLTMIAHPSRRYVIELIAPEELLCLSRQTLRIHVDRDVWECIEDRWPVVVRWKRRLQPGGAGRPQWRQRQAFLDNLLSGGSRLRCSFDISDDPEDESGHVLGLRMAGPSPAEPERNRAAFVHRLLEGHPYMLWPREPLDDEDAFVQAARACVDAATLEDLPRHLCSARANAGSMLYGSVLLIDEVRRNPLDPI